MAKGKKTRQADQARVIKAAMEDPELSLRDIEKKTGVKKDTVMRTIKEIPEIVATSGDKGETIIDAIDKIIEDTTRITRLHLEQLKDKEQISTKDVKSLSDIRDSYFKHKQLLTGQATERVDHTVIDFSSMTKAQKEEYRKKLLGK